MCLALIGPSAHRGEPSARALPAGTATAVVPGRVMTWNLCNPCGARNLDRAAQIAAHAPQLIALQEACTRDVKSIRDHLEEFYGLRYHLAHGPVLRSWSRCGGWPWSPGGYGQAVLSAAPMTDPVTVEYPHGGSEDRGYMAVTTQVGGQRVRVFNTHLAERRQEHVRAKQTRVLAAAITRHDHAIALGDFNAVPDAPELTPIWALATDTSARCHPPSHTTCEPTTHWHSKFDYIFLRGITPIEHHVQPTPHSDHDPLHTDLQTQNH
ncbi:endonuclease/exonuclease/phosphatase family protein [Streptomyces sp. NPDC003393]